MKTAVTKRAGIGLAVVKEFTEAQGGQAWAEANPAGGSVFSFSLDRAAAGSADSASRMAAS